MDTHLYKKKLTAKLQELQKRQISPQDIAVEQNADLMDGIQRTTERELALTTLALSWKTSVAVHAALDRIADSSYGLCLGCEEPISDRRLAVIPWAEQCISCQQREEELEPAVAEAA